MTTSQKTVNIIIIILVVIGIGLAIAALVISNKKQPPIYPGGPPAPKPAFGAALANILAQALQGDWWKDLFGKSDYAKKNCDPNKKGYNKNGILDPSCGATTGACNPFECDPNKPGYDMCGDRNALQCD